MCVRIHTRICKYVMAGAYLPSPELNWVKQHIKVNVEMKVCDLIQMNLWLELIIRLA